MLPAFLLLLSLLLPRSLAASWIILHHHPVVEPGTCSLRIMHLSSTFHTIVTILLFHLSLRFLSICTLAILIVAIIANLGFVVYIFVSVIPEADTIIGSWHRWPGNFGAQGSRATTSASSRMIRATSNFQGFTHTTAGFCLTCSWGLEAMLQAVLVLRLSSAKHQGTLQHLGAQKAT